MFLSRDVMRPILCLCEESDTPRSLAVKLLLESEEWDQLVGLTVDPGSYRSSSAYFRDVVVTDLLRKCEGLPTTVDKRQAAVDSFWDAEKSCYAANERLAPYLFGLSSPESNERVWEVISLARKYLSFVLGSCPDTLDGRFGPGATFGDRGRYTTVPDKMSSHPSLTSASYGFLLQWGGTAWARACASANKSPKFVEGNRFTTVPKDSKKDRGIAIEPSINLFYQLGYGRVLRERLRRAGIDLQNGQDIHRRVACEASIKGHLSTIDLSSASDTVCRNLVKLLLPQRWYDSLESLRSSRTQMPGGKWVVLEKFSSMGNGYTFELETAIFLSIAYAVCALGGHLPKEGENLFVYGDDIIIPTAASADVLAALAFFGFTPNRRKTFVCGSFRESCGGDYFDGRPVRAFYLKELPNEPHQWIAWANGLRTVVYDHLGVDRRDHHPIRSWARILDAIPWSVRELRGPPELGDLVVHDAERTWKPHSRNGRKNLGAYDGRQGDGIRYFKCWRPAGYRRVEWKHFRPEVVLASALYGEGDGCSGVTPRDSVTGYVHGWVPLS